VLEVVNNGHVDGLAIVFLLGALIALAPRPEGPRSGLAGALIGAAALVKLYPAVALVAVVGATRTRRWGPLVRAGGAAVALTAVAYLPHVRAVGTKVLGYLPGYLREEHYQQGGRFLIAAALHLPTHVRGPASVAALAAVAAWVLVRRPPVPAAVALLFGTLLLAVSPVQPWYAVGLLAAAAVAAEPRWVAVILAGYPYFFAVILASPHAALIGELSYGAAAVCVLVMGNVARMPAGPSVTVEPSAVGSDHTIDLPGGSSERLAGSLTGQGAFRRVPLCDGAPR
jgi:hypothetical protein